MSSIILMAVLLLFAARILFAIEAMLCKLIDILYEAFEIFAGIKTVLYEGQKNYIINVFFDNDVITAVYWGMACIGFALTFGFAIAAIVKKMFDSTGEKVKGSNAQILINTFKSILLILLMTAIVSATINATGTLMQAVDTLFDNAYEYAYPSKIVFTETDFKDMYDIMDTIGNYALNPSYESRFNVNSCFNEIRIKLQKLAQTNIFAFSYAKAPDSWQYTLLQIYSAADVYQDIPIDSYNEGMILTLSDCMYRLKTDKNFLPLESYQESASMAGLGGLLGRTIMLSCTMDSANNPEFNKHASLTDALRKPYYVGEKDCYSYSQMEDDFDIGLFSYQHVVALIVAFFVVKEMAAILINCTGRIFNIMILYITAPGFIAVMPLDDGGKFKQWTTAFIIQSLSIFGSVVAVRLLIMFIPIVLSTDLVLFEESFPNAVAKLAFVIGICVTSEKASGMISGILADNAGYQSIMAGDVGGGLVSKGMSLAGGALKAGAKMGFSAGAKVLGGLSDATGLTTAANKVGGKVGNWATQKLGGLDNLKNVGQAMREHGGVVGAWKKGFQTKEALAKKGEAKDKKADGQKQKETGMMDNLKKEIQDLTGIGSGSSGSEGGGGPQNNNSGEGGGPSNNNSGEGGGGPSVGDNKGGQIPPSIPNNNEGGGSEGDDEDVGFMDEE
ncbi:MAG: hypothetical protein MJ148_04430 [Clostridia bacterium]|nr:hypothetical protein [Clostridia bacterium]